MFDESNIEDVEQSGNPIEDFSQWLDQQIEELDELQSEAEAELGELFRSPSGQFENCELVDDQTPTLLGVIEDEGDDE